MKIMSRKPSKKEIQIAADIVALSRKYEMPVGVMPNGIATLPDLMYIIFLEYELNNLKERVGIPVRKCDKCGHIVETVQQFETEGLGGMYENMQEAFKTISELHPRRESKKKKKGKGPGKK